MVGKITTYLLNQTTYIHHSSYQMNVHTICASSQLAPSFVLVVVVDASPFPLTCFILFVYCAIIFPFSIFASQAAFMLIICKMHFISLFFLTYHFSLTSTVHCFSAISSFFICAVPSTYHQGSHGIIRSTRDC